MSLNEPQIVIHGNLTEDPQLQFTPNGKAVARFTVAQNPRFKQNGEWTDGTPTFFRCEVWGRPAENVAESFQRGNMLLVVGRIRTNEYEDRETGDPKRYQFISVDAVGASVMTTAVQIKRVRRNNDGATGDPWESDGNSTPQNDAGQAETESAESPEPTAKPAARRSRAKTSTAKGTADKT